MLKKTKETKTSVYSKNNSRGPVKLGCSCLIFLEFDVLMLDEIRNFKGFPQKKDSRLL